MNPRVQTMVDNAGSGNELVARGRQMILTDKSIISLVVGEPDFNTPKKVVDATMESLLNGETHYINCEGVGRKDLRTAIAKYITDRCGIKVDYKHVIITVGAKGALYTAIQTIISEGDEGIVVDPAFVCYYPIVESTGAKLVHAKLDPENNYRISREFLEKYTTERTRMVLICYPNNPTGMILHEDEAKELEEYMLAHPDVYVVADEVYESLVFDGKRSVSLGSLESVADRVITINGFSKIAAMTGWRLGYIVCPNDEFIRNASKLFTESASSVAGFLQRGAIKVFECEEEIEMMRQAYERRRDMFVGKLNAIPGVKVVNPEGAFYAFAIFDDKYGMSSVEMCSYFLDNKVLGQPGDNYGEYDKCAVRFSFATSDELLSKAADMIADALAKLREEKNIVF